MNETVISILLGSTLLVSIINMIKDIYLWKANRSATIADRTETKKDKLKDLEDKVSEHTELLEKILDSINNFEQSYNKEIVKQGKINKSIITDCLRNKCSILLTKDKITFNERKELIEMWNIYHNELGGNGNFNDIMEEILNMEVDMNH